MQLLSLVISQTRLIPIWRYDCVNYTNLAIKGGRTIIFYKILFAFLLLFGHEAPSARAFPVPPVHVAGRKSCLHHISAGCTQKPRPLEPTVEGRHEDASRRTSPSARYRASKSSKVMGGLGVPKVCISSIVFVVKTTRRSNVAPFDALDDICRPRRLSPDPLRVASRGHHPLRTALRRAFSFPNRPFLAPWSTRRHHDHVLGFRL